MEEKGFVLVVLACILVIFFIAGIIFIVGQESKDYPPYLRINVQQDNEFINALWKDEN